MTLKYNDISYKICKKRSSESAQYLNCDTVLLPLEDQAQEIWRPYFLKMADYNEEIYILCEIVLIHWKWRRYSWNLVWLFLLYASKSLHSYVLFQLGSIG